MASIFLSINQTGYNIANTGDVVYAQTGFESVNSLVGVSNIDLDQNIEQVSLAGDMDDLIWVSDQTTYVGEGNDTFPYSAVVYIQSTFPSGITYKGTGAVVGENDVLTAAHVGQRLFDQGKKKRIPVHHNCFRRSVVRKSLPDLLRHSQGSGVVRGCIPGSLFSSTGGYQPHIEECLVFPASTSPLAIEI